MSASRPTGGDGARDEGSHGGAIRDLLADSGFLSAWVVGWLTWVVRWLQLLVLGLYTFELTGSPLLVSVVPMLSMLPLALCGPLVGALADRVDRKWLLCGAIATMLAVSVVTALLARLGDLSFGYIVGLSLVSGLFWATDFPVRRRLLGDLAGGSLSAAMSLDSATGNATRMIGPLLGGVALEFFSISGVFVLSAAMYTAALVLALLVRVPPAEGTTSARVSSRGLFGGVRYVLGDRNLRRVFTITIVFNMWGFPFTSMIPVIGSDQLDLGASLVGVFSSLEGLGASVGAVLVALLIRPQYFFATYLWGTTFYIAMVGYLGVLISVAGGPLHSFVAASVALASIGMASACFAAMQGTLTYLGAPPEYRSRVLGVLTLCIGTGPIGFFNVGWMAELFGVPAALIIVSAEGLVALLALWVYGSERSAEEDGFAGSLRATKDPRSG